MFVYAMSHPSASGRSPTWLWRILGERIYGNFICWNEKSLLLVKEGNLQKRLLFCMHYISNVVPFQFSSVAQSCPTLCDPVNRSTPGLPVHHQLPEFTQTHIIELVMPSSHLILSSPSPPAPNPSQHQGLFQWVSSSHEVAKVLEFQPQHQSFQWTPRTDLL